MKISAKLAVACFCAALIINPIVLLTLFSQSTNSAISGIVSLWDASAATSVDSVINSQVGTPLSRWTSYVATAVSEYLDLNRVYFSSAAADSYWASDQPQTDLGQLLGQYEALVRLSFGGNEFSPDFSFVVARSLSDVTCFDGSLAYQIAAHGAVTNAGSSLSSSGSANDISSSVNVSLSSILAAKLCLRNVSKSVEVTIHKFSGSKWCDDLQSAIDATVDDAENLAAFASLAIAAHTWATAPIAFSTKNATSKNAFSSSLLVLAVASPLAAINPSILRCPSVVTTAAVASLLVNQTNRAFLTALSGGVQVAIPIEGAAILQNVIISIGASSAANSQVNRTTSLSIARRSWLMQALLGGSLSTTLALNVPSPFVVVLALWDPSGLQTSARSRLQILGCDTFEAIGTASDLCPEVQSYDISKFVPPLTVESASNTFFIDLDSVYFISMKPLTWAAAGSPTASLQTTFLMSGIFVDTSTSKALLSSALSNSVILAVSFTAVVFVTTLTVLHFMFHPLKVVGTLLRCCADIRLHALEAQSPSVIREINDLQRAVDQLIHRVRAIGKYIPDKSQLYSAASSRDAEALVDLMKSGSGNGAKENPFASKNRPERLLGVIAHSITVRVEYRSRRKPTEDRDANDTKKTSIFEFVYSAQDSVHDALLQQCRERLREREGEVLRMFDKHTAVGGVPLSQCTPLFMDEDVLEAIERCYDRVLHIIVVKASEKSFGSWARALLLIAEFGCVVNAGVHFLGGSNFAEDADVSATLQKTGIALFVTALFRLVANTLATVYLVRTFSQTDSKFSAWVPSAMTETMVVTLLSSVSIVNLTVLFSNTRITASLRFNAPYADHFQNRIFRWTVWSILYNQVLPLGLCANILAVRRGFEVNAWFGMMLPAVVIVVFLVENFFDALIQKIRIRISGQDGFGTPRATSVDRVGSLSPSQRTSILEPWLSTGSVSDDGDDSDFEELSSRHASTADENNMIGYDDEADVARKSSLLLQNRRNSNDVVAGRRKASVTFAVEDQVTPPDPPIQTDAHLRANRSLYLGLSKRPVTILQISLLRAAAHFDMMGVLEIQTFCSTFLSLIFAETRTHGGFILKVSNVTVSIGFNCHQMQLNHFERSLGCYFSIANLVQRNLLRWSEDDAESPQVTGAILSGGKYVIGFAGNGEARTFQFMGRGKRELRHVAGMAQLYGVSLACNHAAATLIENQLRSGVPLSSRQSFAATDQSSLLSSHDTRAPPLMVRLIENIVEYRHTHILTSAVTAAKKSARAAPLSKFVGVGTTELTRVYEIVWDEGSESMMHSSRTALAFLDIPFSSSLRRKSNTSSARQKQQQKSTAAENGSDAHDRLSTAAAPVSPVSLMTSHLSLFPHDTVARSVFRRLISNDSPFREYCCLGMDLASSEVSNEVETTEGVKSSASPPAALAHQSSVVSRICSSDKYVVFFTDL